MTLELKYKADTTVPVEVEGLVPSFVRDKSLAELEKFQIFHGNEKLTLGDYFSVSGDPSDGCMRFSGDLRGVHWIGAGMTEGVIHVEGGAGRHVGSEMTGGEIHVHGPAGDWVGGEMHGGLIHVEGSAGHLIGSAYRGSRRGMTGGTIIIDGSVGNEIGHTMRRGLLVVGACGDFVGLNMIAGSIFVLGKCGIRHAAGMRRGTVALLGEERPHMLPTFRYSCRFRPLIFELIYRQIRAVGGSLPADLLTIEYDLHHGDMLAGGRGELYVRA